MQEGLCSLEKPGREGARNCALGLLRKALYRPVPETREVDLSDSYTAEEIEEIISDIFPVRETYLSKISKIALHLSLFTRTGRVSYTFQEGIFNKKRTSADEDYLTWLLTNATEEEMFPELFQSFGYVDELDRQSFEKQMRLEHSSLLEGLRYVVQKCCDSKVCTVDEIDTTYEEELFKSGTPFHTAAKNICMTRKLEQWIPPANDVTIPDMTPVGSRNFGLTGQIMCFDVHNLIHNFAILEEGRLLQLPWGREHLNSEVQEELMEQFRVEVAMRRYFLDQRR